ncbi:SDR family oxidoreductase [Dactylosporangium siamense]|uniref:Short-chain dehydrogenase n=1 Tax=Dactylosporangium siamense TaxID=685454 RepID=A0A919PUV2_9ACTN|nr:short-chain dehydrogenase [Dactylosporangium siamense]
MITGAAQGLGRAHALAFASAGARLVLNDLDAGALAEVAALTGAVAVPGDIADWDFAAALIGTAVAEHGRLDALVNNAGLARDRMVVNLAEDEWDAVMRVNLKGTAAPLRHAAAHWRARSKAGEAVAARVVNTTSGAGLMGSVGQASYSAAKAGIAALTQVAAAELARYGVTVNAIAPSARTAMTEVVFADAMRAPLSGADFDAMAPENVSPLVVWLAGADSGDVTGRVFEVSGGSVSVAGGWQHGETRDAGRRWHPDELGPVVRDLLSRAPAPAAVYGA